MSVFGLAVFIIAVALLFDYINGFHDAANSIATIVSTRVFRRSRPFCGRLFSILPLPFSLELQWPKQWEKGLSIWTL